MSKIGDGVSFDANSPYKAFIEIMIQWRRIFDRKRKPYFVAIVEMPLAYGACTKKIFLLKLREMDSIRN